MAEEYRTVYQGGQAEIVEKKSRFIATVRPVTTEEEALAFIAEMKKQYWDARHNCYAYVVGEQPETQRCSDDGEPQGTAGKPILDVLLGRQLHNTAIVVTRYFGGVLLGTGGLVRAYQGAASEGIKESVVIARKAGVRVSICTDYTGYGKIQYILGQRQIPVLRTDFTDKVEIEIVVPEEEWRQVETELTEGTNGKAEMEVLEKCRFADADGDILLFH